jgi:hypothetical protein
VSPTIATAGSIDFQESCRKVAKEILNNKQAQLQKQINDLAKSTSQEDSLKLDGIEQKNHFNKINNKCFVKIEFTQTQYVKNYNSSGYWWTTYLYDGYENRLIAMCNLTKFRQNNEEISQVTSCGVLTLDERSFTKPFLTINEYQTYISSYFLDE